MVLPILIPVTESWAVPHALGSTLAPSPENRMTFKSGRRLCLEDSLPRGRKFWPPRLPHRSGAHGPRLSAGDVMKLCELVVISNLRRWSQEMRCNGRHVYAIAKSCDASLRVLAGLLDRDAMAWVLQAMYWNGLSHPMSLTVAPLHPPTGVHRWLMASPQCAVFGDPVTATWQFARVMRAYRARALAVSGLLLKREVQQGRVRLRPELLNDQFWNS